MKGLLLKDFFWLRTYGRTILLVMGVYIGFALVTKDATMMPSLIMVFSAMLPVTSLGVDEQAKWDGYAQCMPVSRRQVVLSKYILLLVVIALGSALSLGVSGLVALLYGGGMAEALWILTLMLGATLLINAFALPIVFRIGAEKARVVIILLFVVFAMPFLFLQGNTAALENILRVARWALPIGGLALFAGAYRVSVRIYEAKEF